MDWGMSWLMSFLAERLVTNYADLYRLSVENIANVNWLRKRKGKDGALD